RRCRAQSHEYPLTSARLDDRQAESPLPCSKSSNSDCIVARRGGTVLDRRQTSFARPAHTGAMSEATLVPAPPAPVTEPPLGCPPPEQRDVDLPSFETLNR